MRKNEMVPMSIVVPRSLYQLLERARRHRMRTSGGHVPRSELIREAIFNHLSEGHAQLPGEQRVGDGVSD